MYDNEQYFFEPLKAGASGYVLKSVADQDLLNACHAAMRGKLFIYPGVMSALMRSHLERLRRGEWVATNVLTAREDQVLKLIAEGYPSKAIAETLTISPKTVEHHRANILQKLGDARPNRADPLRHPGGPDRTVRLSRDARQRPSTKDPHGRPRWLR